MGKKVKQGEWFEGNIHSSEQGWGFLLKAKKKYATDVMQPRASRTKIIDGKVYSQYYYKPYNK